METWLNVRFASLLLQTILSLREDINLDRSEKLDFLIVTFSYVA